MAEPSTENALETSENTGPVERLRSWGRIVSFLVILILLFGDIGLFSLHQAQKARLEILNHRVERIDKMVHDILASQDNAEKIEMIEQRVNTLGSNIGALKKTLEAEAEESPTPEPSKKTKTR